MTKFEDNLSPYLTIVEATEPTAPSAGQQRLYIDSTSHLLKATNSAGTERTLEGLTDPMTTRGDVIVRNASNVTARLAIGSSGKVLSSDGTDISWQTPAGGSVTFVGARAYSNATQSISDSTITAITFNSENYDTSAIHDTGSNTSRMTASATGYWRFTGGTVWDTNTTAARYLWWRKNGSTEVNGGMVEMNPTTVGLAMFTSVTLSLSATDYMELMCYQTSGGARTIGGTVADIKFESWLEAAYLGS